MLLAPSFVLQVKYQFPVSIAKMKILFSIHRGKKHKIGMILINEMGGTKLDGYIENLEMAHLNSVAEKKLKEFEREIHTLQGEKVIILAYSDSRYE